MRLWIWKACGFLDERERYEAAVSREPERLDYHAQDTGNIYIRSSWKEDANYTYLSCGPQGSGHGHGDLTHISLYYQGKPFLIDSGRYSYREDEPLRMEFKMLQAHKIRTEQPLCRDEVLKSHENSHHGNVAE